MRLAPQDDDQTKTPERLFSPVPNCFAVCRRCGRQSPKSERTQQNCANEHKHGAHRQHIEFQGMVHDAPPLDEGRTKYNRLCRFAEARRRYAPSPSTASVMQIANAVPKRLIAREKKFMPKIVAVRN
jgi:hypothetical protein